MMIKATVTGMKPFTTEELRQHIVATDAKFQKMPASLRRNSMESWPNNRAAIVRGHLFTNDGEEDIEAGTVVAIKYRCTARNQILRRSEPVYTLKDYNIDIYANNLASFVL